MKKSAYIFDVDGTLVDTSSVIHHVLKRPKDFDAFHSEALNAPPHHHVIKMTHKAKFDGHDVIVVTARREKWKMQTELWLKTHGVPYDAIYTRGNKDYRPDYEVKKDILKTIENDWFVVHAVDDNPNVIKLWEEHGIPTTTVEGWIG